MKKDEYDKWVEKWVGDIFLNLQGMKFFELELKDQIIVLESVLLRIMP